MTQWRLLFIIYFAFIGCSQPDTRNLEHVAKSAEFLRGYVCTASPSEAFAPGYVYRIDEQNSSFLVRLLTDRAETFTFLAALGTYTASISGGGGIEFGALTPIESATGEVEANSSGSQLSKISFSEGQFVQMTDEGASKLVEVATKELDPIPGSRYFVVRDTIQARGIDISLSTTDVTKLGGQTSIAGLFSASPSFTVSRGEALTIRGNFSTPFNVCIRPVALEPIIRDPNQPVVVAEGEATWRLTTTLASPADVTRILDY